MKQTYRQTEGQNYKLIDGHTDKQRNNTDKMIDIDP